MESGNRYSDKSVSLHSPSLVTLEARIGSPHYTVFIYVEPGTLLIECRKIKPIAVHKLSKNRNSSMHLLTIVKSRKHNGNHCTFYSIKDKAGLA